MVDKVAEGVGAMSVEDREREKRDQKRAKAQRKREKQREKVEKKKKERERGNKLEKKSHIRLDLNKACCPRDGHRASLVAWVSYARRFARSVISLGTDGRNGWPW